MTRDRADTPGLGGFRVQVNDLRRRLGDRVAAQRLHEDTRQRRDPLRVVEVVDRDPASGLARVRLADGSVRLVNETQLAAAGLTRPVEGTARRATVAQVPGRAKRPAGARFPHDSLPGGAGLCYIYARFVGSTLELWEHRPLSDQWRLLGDVDWSLKWLQYLYESIGDWAVPWTRFETIRSLGLDELGSPQTVHVFGTGFEYGLEYFQEDYEQWDEPLSLEIVQSWEGLTQSSEPARFWFVGESLDTPLNVTLYQGTASNLTVVPCVGSGSKGIRLLLSELPTATLFDNLVSGKYIRRHENPYSWVAPQFGPGWKIHNYWRYQWAEKHVRPEWWGTGALLVDYYGDLEENVGPSWLNLEDDLTFSAVAGELGASPSRPDTRTLTQLLNGSGLRRERTVLLSGAEVPDPPDTSSFTSISHLGTTFGTGGAMGRVVFEHNGDRVAATNQQDANDPDQAWFINGYRFLKDQARTVKLAVVDPGSLPEPLIAAIEARNADGPWCPFGHPDWAMDGSWWPVASVYW